MNFLTYEEYSRTKIAALRFVLGKLLVMSDIVPSHFEMHQVAPDEYERSPCTKDNPGHSYYLVHLQSDNSQVKKKVFLQLEIACDNGKDIHTQVVGYYFCTNKEVPEFDLINGPYISVK